MQSQQKIPKAFFGLGERWGAFGGGTSKSKKEGLAAASPISFDYISFAVRR
jgi:hypothetical protein